MSRGGSRSHMAAAAARSLELRRYRRQVKQRVRLGELSVVDAVRDPMVETMSLAELLMAQPGWGARVTISALEGAGIFAVTVGDLSWADLQQLPVMLGKRGRR